MTRMRDRQLSVGAFVRIVVRQRVVGEVERRQTYTVKHRVDRRNHAMPLSRRIQRHFGGSALTLATKDTARMRKRDRDIQVKRLEPNISERAK